MLYSVELRSLPRHLFLFSGCKGTYFFGTDQTFFLLFLKKVFFSLVFPLFFVILQAEMKRIIPFIVSTLAMAACQKSWNHPAVTVDTDSTATMAFALPSHITVTTLDSLFKVGSPNLSSAYLTLQSELKYYLDRHNVQDEGYEMVARRRPVQPPERGQMGWCRQAWHWYRDRLLRTYHHCPLCC